MSNCKLFFVLIAYLKRSEGLFCGLFRWKEKGRHEREMSVRSVNHKEWDGWMEREKCWKGRKKSKERTRWSGKISRKRLKKSSNFDSSSQDKSSKRWKMGDDENTKKHLSNSSKFVAVLFLHRELVFPNLQQHFSECNDPLVMANGDG